MSSVRDIVEGRGGALLSPSLTGPIADGSVEVLGEAPTSPAGEGEPVPVRASSSPGLGGSFGRYELEARLGAGGMGLVSRAYDPMLDRRVALKIVRPAGGGRDAQRRLYREAQALARVRHPNVVAVHDVGVLGDDVFVAMDLVEGTRLSEWQVDRDWREVLRAYSAAARGLAAAHARGLVHRDVKPQTIMIGGDGCVTVIDFGLAALVPEAESPPPPPARLETSEITGSSFGDNLTQAGDRIGTPRYMSPEQHMRTRVDERSDQYSLAIAAYEGLCGVWPFELRRRGGGAVQRAKLRGVLAPVARAIPRRIRRALLRGLAFAPEERWPSMAAFADALREAPRAPRLALGISAAAMIAIGAVGLGAGAPQPLALCRADAGKLDRV
jgi:serine/threonine protein kinase